MGYWCAKELMLEERRSLGGYGCRIKDGFGVNEKIVIVANLNYVAQLLTTRDMQWLVRSVADQDFLGVIIHSMCK